MNFGEMPLGETNAFWLLFYLQVLLPTEKIGTGVGVNMHNVWSITHKKELHYMVNADFVPPMAQINVYFLLIKYFCFTLFLFIRLASNFPKNVMFLLGKILFWTQGIILNVSVEHLYVEYFSNILFFNSYFKILIYQYLL